MSHPIALPMPVASQQQQDPYPMALDGSSYNGQEDGRAFNPASYTRHFLGSPISWRAGSFGATYCATSASPTAMLVGSYELGPGRSPLKSPDNSILNAWNVFDRQGELCRNYTCCGAHLPDLHALLEHFEEVHIVVRGGQPPSIQIPFNPQTNPPEQSAHAPADNNNAHLLQQPQYSTPFDTDDMDLGDAMYDVDVGDASPPPPSTAPTSTVTSRAPSPSPNSPLNSHLAHTAKPALNISLSGVGFPPSFQPHSSSLANAHGHGHAGHGTHTPFSAYARYNAEYSPGGAGTGQVTPQDVADYTPSPPDSSAHSGAFLHDGIESAIAPALVFGREEELLLDGSPVASTSALPSGSQGGKVPKAKARSSGGSGGASRSAPPSRLGTPPGFASGSGAGASAAHAPHAGPASAHPSSSHGQGSFPAHAAANANGAGVSSGGATGSPTILLPHKPFRCPKPNCSKSYKQANGLKYHITHGSCNYGPAKDLEAVRALLERKRANASVAQALSTAQNPTHGGALGHDAAEDSEEGGAGGGIGVGGGGMGEGLSQAELNEVEARVRPFACGVGDCARRYKNMNGLRYHYQHSGDHGAVGLGMLAGGVHGCLRNNSSSPSTSSSTNSATSATNSTLNSTSTPGTPTGKGKAGAGAGAYAWGSTLLPHIQAVSATTATTAATATASAASASASNAASTASSPASTPSTTTTTSAGGKKGKGKTEATAFAVPTSAGASASASAKANSAPGTPTTLTSTFPAVPGPALPTAATSAFAGVGAGAPTAAAQGQTQAQAQQSQTEYLAQLQRAQYAQYQQWYVSAQQQAQAQAAAAAQAQQQAQAQAQAQQQQQQQAQRGQDVTMG
ncbi:hypothetical protein C8F04DRAFT_1259617 [Mycena alexandri]|uniref:C2H2-type domain-containing protein n=1 Tax=Mycena alexandri TaxID=1745969 RepID=A0AAD6SX31_9AGAR|nr:hypothetical protein C8F04DRAFT_1259617 [Mycena alexandri]